MRFRGGWGYTPGERDVAAERDARPRPADATTRPDDAASIRTAGGDSAAATAGGLPPGTVPATVAIALEHDPAGGALPRVVASGRGFVAEQILTLAFANGVRVRQDADLAQILAQVDLDSEIPTEAFAAVAEILAYVYKANGNTDVWREVMAP